MIAHSALPHGQGTVITSRAPFERLVLLEPDLRDTGGHFHDFTNAMRLAAVAQGLRFTAVGNKTAANGFADLTVTPAFDRLSERFVPAWAGGYVLDPLVGERRFAAHLSRSVTPLCGAATVVLAATANHRHYRALASWLAGLSTVDAPALAVMLRFSEFDAVHGRWRRTAMLTRRGLHALERVANRYRVRLLTDSESLAAEYRQLTSLPVRVLPAPYLAPDRLLPSADDPSERDVLRLGFFGQARAEKGFVTLVEAIEHLAARDGLAGLALSVQCYVRIGYEGQAVHESERLRALRARALRLLPEMLDSDAYYREFTACDAMLLPYEPDRYRARTSGVFVDALAAGMPVVTTEGTWMSRELARNGAGVVIPSGDAGALVAAIETLRREWQELRGQALDVAERWRDGRRPRDFVRQTIALFD